MIPSRRVCLLIDTSTSWGTRLIKGIGRHAQEMGDWLIHVEPWGRYERFRVPEGWEGEGIIARSTAKPWPRRSSRRAADRRTLLVSVRAASGSPAARSTRRASGQMAAEYFLSIGFKQFAYCGPLHQLGYPTSLPRRIAQKFKTQTRSLPHRTRRPATTSTRLPGMPT